jgi:hypothetical protein
VAEPVVEQEPPAQAAETRGVAPSEAPAQVAQAERSADRFERRAAAAARREEKAQRRAAPAAVQEPPAEEPVPTPYGRLHVFGAADGAGQDGASAEDRAARLRQLREKMLKARREASERGKGGEESAVAIVVPPPPGGAAPAPEAAPAPAAAAAPAPQEPPAEAPAVAAADPAVAEPPPEPVVRRPTAVGVSVGGDAPAATEGEIRDPDIVMQDDPPAPAAAEPAPPAGEPVAVAAVPRADVAPPPAAPAPPVLRRSPGGAPQVSINILQWSTEPGRRFAFVSIDGGGMTQVREGDRIGSLTVKHIHQQMIEFGFNDSTFLLRAN